jgi:sortase (surface protein transpeptidase)
VSDYRIIQNTHRDLTFTYKIEKRSEVDPTRWNTITTRDSIDEARHATKQLYNQEIISSEVVK